MKKPKRESKPERTAPKSGPASADAVDQSAAAPGAQAPGNDTAPPAAAAASSFAAAVEALAAPVFVTLRFPLPADIPPQALASASVIVTAKSERGRRRGGATFTRAETAIPYPDLSEQQLAALIGDTELTVSLRVPKPA